MSVDLYETLGVTKDAEPADIKSAFRKKAKAAHPDTGGDAEAFALICRAKDVLSDSKRREKYDRTGKYEDNEPDRTEAEALQIALQAIMHVVQQIEHYRGHKVEHYDVLRDAMTKIRADIRVMRENRDAALAQATKQRILAKRFKGKKGKPNRIAPLFEGQARQMGEQAEAAARFLPAHELALKLLADHEFEIDPSWR